MSGFMAKTIGGIPVMSEREFVEAKAARIAEDDARKAEEQAAIAEQAALEKKERTGHVRKQKSSALQRRIAAAAEKNETAAAERAAAVQSKLKESGGGPRNSAMGVPLVQSDGRRSSDPNLVIDLDEKAKLTDHPFKRPEKPMIDVAPGSPKRGRASVAEREAAKREIEMGLEMGRLRLEEDNTGMVFCVQMDTNQRRYDLDPMQHGICLPDANDVFEDGFKTIKRGATARDLVKDHATKQKREMRRQNSVQLEDRAAAFLASLK
eukprot:gene5351-34085_t